MLVLVTNAFGKLQKKAMGFIVLFFMMRGSKDKLVVPNLSFSEFVSWRYLCTLNFKYGSFINGYARFRGEGMSAKASGETNPGGVAASDLMI